MEKIKVGIIGLGNITKNAHIPQLKDCEDAVITAICDVDPKTLKTIGDELDIDEKYRYTNYNDLINCSEVDAVEVCTPNYLHSEMAVAAIKAGKPVNIEKPLALNLDQANAVSAALKANPVPSMMCFSYRFFPAVRYAKWILEQNLIGDLVSVDVAYLKSSAFWEGRRLDWRFQKELAGTGVLGDLGCHLIDMTHFLVGNIKAVSAKTNIVVKERKKLDSEEFAKVTTDDYCSFIALLENDVNATFNITRCAVGNDNTIKYDIFGTKGAISFNLNDPTVIDVCIGAVDMKSNSLHTVNVPPEFNTTQERAFIDTIKGEVQDFYPPVSAGLRCQAVLDSILESDKQNCWVDIDERMKKIYDDNLLDTVFRIETRVQGSREIAPTWRRNFKNGGGMLYDWGPHLIDQILYMIPSKVTSVYAEFQYVRQNEVDENVRITLKFENGMSALVEIGTCNYIMLPIWYMCGKEGTAQIDYWNLEGRILKLINKEISFYDEIPSTLVGPSITMAPRNSDTVKEYPLPEPEYDKDLFYKNFVNALEGKEELFVKVEEIIRTTTIIDLAFKSGKENQAIKCYI